MKLWVENHEIKFMKQNVGWLCLIFSSAEAPTNVFIVSFRKN